MTWGLGFKSSSAGDESKTNDGSSNNNDNSNNVAADTYNNNTNNTHESSGIPDPQGMASNPFAMGGGFGGDDGLPSPTEISSAYPSYDNPFGSPSADTTIPPPLSSRQQQRQQPETNSMMPVMMSTTTPSPMNHGPNTTMGGGGDTSSMMGLTPPASSPPMVMTQQQQQPPQHPMTTTTTTTAPPPGSSHDDPFSVIDKRSSITPSPPSATQTSPFMTPAAPQTSPSMTSAAPSSMTMTPEKSDDDDPFSVIDNSTPAGVVSPPSPPTVHDDDDDPFSVIDNAAPSQPPPSLGGTMKSSGGIPSPSADDKDDDPFSVIDNAAPLQPPPSLGGMMNSSGGIPSPSADDKDDDPFGVIDNAAPSQPPPSLGGTMNSSGGIPPPSADDDDDDPFSVIDGGGQQPEPPKLMGHDETNITSPVTAAPKEETSNEDLLFGGGMPSPSPEEFVVNDNPDKKETATMEENDNKNTSGLLLPDPMELTTDTPTTPNDNIENNSNDDNIGLSLPNPEELKSTPPTSNLSLLDQPALVENDTGGSSLPNPEELKGHTSTMTNKPDEGDDLLGFAGEWGQTTTDYERGTPSDKQGQQQQQSDNLFGDHLAPDSTTTAATTTHDDQENPFNAPFVTATTTTTTDNDDDQTIESRDFRSAYIQSINQTSSSPYPDQAPHPTHADEPTANRELVTPPPTNQTVVHYGKADNYTDLPYDSDDENHPGHYPDPEPDPASASGMKTPWTKQKSEHAPLPTHDEEEERPRQIRKKSSCERKCGPYIYRHKCCLTFWLVFLLVIIGGLSYALWFVYKVWDPPVPIIYVYNETRSEIPSGRPSGSARPSGRPSLRPSASRAPSKEGGGGGGTMSAVPSLRPSRSPSHKQADPTTVPPAPTTTPSLSPSNTPSTNATSNSTGDTASWQYSLLSTTDDSPSTTPTTVALSPTNTMFYASPIQSLLYRSYKEPTTLHSIYDQGTAVALSPNGQLAVTANNIDGGDSHGVVRAYRLTGTSWLQRGELISGSPKEEEGSYLAVGSVGESATMIIAVGTPKASNGRVRVYEYQIAAMDWVQVMEKTDLGLHNMGLGRALALRGRYLVVGRSSVDGLKGRVSVFERGDDGAWVGLGEDIAMVEATGEGVMFGWSVSVSDDGLVCGCAVGATVGGVPNVGMCGLWRFVTDIWERVGNNGWSAQLEGSTANAKYGYDVSLSNDGTKLAVVSMDASYDVDSGGGGGKGNVHLYDIDFNQSKVTKDEMLRGDVGDTFGLTVQMATSKALVVGARGDGKMKAFVYSESEEERFGLF